MTFMFFATVLALGQASPVSDIPTCAALAAEGARLQSELSEIQQEIRRQDTRGRHSERAIDAGLALNLLGAVAPVRGLQTITSAGAIALGAGARAADQAEADRAFDALDQRMDAALDRMDELADRHDVLCSPGAS